MKQEQKGQVLVEAIVSLTILILGFLGVFNLLRQGLYQNPDIQNKAIAYQLSVEGIEIIRNILDSNLSAEPKLLWRDNLANGYYQVNYNCDLGEIDEEFCFYLTSGNLGNLDQAFSMAEPITINNGFYENSKNSGREETIFKRVVNVSDSPLDTSVVVTSYVRFKNHDKEETINLMAQFYNWRQ